VRFPGLQVAGTRDGFFTDEQTPATVANIAESGARLLFVGMGSPRQEFWLAEHLRETGCGAGVGVGGSFDVISGRVDRAPRIARRLGLEWLYRLVKEPRRWRRQLALPRFRLADSARGVPVKAMILAGACRPDSIRSPNPCPSRSCRSPAFRMPRF